MVPLSSAEVIATSVPDIRRRRRFRRRRSHPAGHDRPDQYKPGADAKLNDPAQTADAVLYALTRPAGSEVRELVVTSSEEGSYP